MTWMQFLTEILKLSAYSIVIVGPILFFGKRFFTGYIDQKSKNLATIEDIDKITSIVEKIKSDNAHVLEELKAEHAKKLEEIRKENQLFVSTVDKHLDLKIKIYTDAMESFTVITNSLAGLSKFSLTESKFTSIIESEAKKTSKVKVVGSVETCKATVELMTAFNSASLELQQHRTPLIICNDRINYLEAKEELNNSEILELDRLKASEKKDFLSFVNLCMEKHNQISYLTTPYIISVRKELGLEIDETELTESENLNSAILEDSFSSFLNAMKGM